VETPSLRTKDISSSGVYFLSPRRLEPGTPLELRVVLVDRPFGRASVTRRTEAHVVRADEASRPGWHGVAVAFDEISFSRGELAPAQSRVE
jgi:PilZ domain